ncbi:MAG: hypothetical protein HC901_02195 [Bdellovibrionaceae bacterium]|nr:hypothetical protein [Pseudobdellovibrionaceae bacterium]
MLQFSGEKDPKVPVAHGRYLDRLGRELGANVTYIEIKNSGHGLKLAGDADGGLSLTQEEFEKICIEHILKWIAR